jgi:hypothetical protein
MLKPKCGKAQNTVWLNSKKAKRCIKKCLWNTGHRSGQNPDINELRWSELVRTVDVVFGHRNGPDQFA